jgi:hypothetical protein
VIEFQTEFNNAVVCSLLASLILFSKRLYSTFVLSVANDFHFNPDFS